MGTEPYRIGAAVSEADIDTVAALFQAYAGSLGVDLGYQDFGAELAALPGKYAAPNGALLLARAPEGAALGCVALRPLEADGCCEMKRLYVTHRRIRTRCTGLGQSAGRIWPAVAEARRIGYREVRLDTLPFMQTAMALYDAMGFVPDPALL